MPAQKIAFIKNGPFSHLNQSFLEALGTVFPEYVIDVFDVKKDLINPFQFQNIIQILREYGREIFSGRKNIVKCQLKNSFMFKEIKKAVAKKIKKDEYVFTFQTQSLFDASVEGIPHFVYTDHTHLANLYYTHFNHKDLYSSSWMNLERTIYENAAITFTMSSNISKSLKEQYSLPQSKIKCIFAGNNVKYCNVLNEKKYNSKNILFVGVEWERKGGPLLVEAFMKILPCHPDATLTIVGCTPKIKLSNCTIIGKIPLSEVHIYYEQAAIFCLPTNLEPFGVVFLEACAHKLPIIGTQIGAIPDIVTEGQNGYLIAPNDQPALEKTLLELLNSPKKCKEFGEAGHDKNMQRYNWNTVAKEFRENVKDVLKKQ